MAGQATSSPKLRTAAFARAGLVLGAVLIVDQVTKRLVIDGIKVGDSRTVIPAVHLVHVRNKGVAFGFFSGGGTLVLVLTLIALAVLLGYFLMRPGRRLLWLPTGLVIGGAIGNLIDRIANGAVTDFIKLPAWPAFNVADMAITFGVLSLLWVLEARRAMPDRPLLELEVPGDAAGARLDRFLAVPLGSRARAQTLIDSRRVLVDGRVRPKRHVVKAGERIEVDQSEEPLAARDADAPFAVVLEDEHLMIVDKPTGVVVHPARGHRQGTLAQALAGRGAGGDEPWRAGIVHRLDRDTSGLLVVAKSDQVHRALKALIASRLLRREYLAFVDGRPSARTGTIDAPIGRDRRDRVLMSIDSDDPREARTHFEIERALPRATLLRVALETGRTHQIRVHMAAIGHPVLGDRQYGGAMRYGLERQFLHAARLVFQHPVTEEIVDVSSPLPDDLAAALARAAADDSS